MLFVLLFYDLGRFPVYIHIWSPDGLNAGRLPLAWLNGFKRRLLLQARFTWLYFPLTEDFRDNVEALKEQKVT